MALCMWGIASQGSVWSVKAGGSRLRFVALTGGCPAVPDVLYLLSFLFFSFDPLSSGHGWLWMGEMPPLAEFPALSK